MEEEKASGDARAGSAQNAAAACRARGARWKCCRRSSRLFYMSVLPRCLHEPCR